MLNLPSLKTFYRRMGGTKIVFLISCVALVAQVLPRNAYFEAWRAQAGQQTAAHIQLKLTDTDRTDVDYFVYVPENYSSATKWPLLLFLHGAEERGADIKQVLTAGPPAYLARGKRLPMIVVSPQCHAGKAWSSQTLLALLDHLTAKYSLDTDRVFVSGYSLGAYGCWNLACAAPDRFAAIVPVAGGGNAELASRLTKLPIWAFHGARDKTVPVEASQRMIEAIRDQGGAPQLTVYEDESHATANSAFFRDDLYAWLLEQHRVR